MGEEAYRMDNKGVISVIVPVYNAEKTLDRLMDSLLSQSYPYLEILPVDDGSRDGSLALLHQYAARDSRVRVLSQPNAGPAAARNAALAAATGDYIAFADSDDSVEPDAYLTMIDAIADCDLVIGRYYFVFGSAAVRGLIEDDRFFDRKEFLEELLKQPGSFYYSALWNKLYRADIIRKMDLRFDKFFTWGEDFAFNVQYDREVRAARAVQMPVYRYYKTVTGVSFRALLRPAHGCAIKNRLYRLFRRIYEEEGLYAGKTKRDVDKYIYNITISE